MNYYKWLNKNTNSLQGKTVAVSGATGGIGVWVCDYLAYLGANIVCLDRNAIKSNKLINNLKMKYPSLNATHITVNLENIVDVNTVAEMLKKLDIDYLILNAGAYKIPRYKCNTGFNNVFMINFISPYFLACELKNSIIKRNGRVVAVSSIAHNYSKIDVNDIDFSNRTAASLVYGNAKRFLTLALYNVFESENNLSIVHPGITLTNITAHFPKFIFAIIKFPMKVIFMHPKKAALSILMGLFNNTQKNQWIGPKHFNIWGLPSKKYLNSFTNDEYKNVAIISEKIISKLNKNL